MLRRKDLTSVDQMALGVMAVEDFSLLLLYLFIKHGFSFNGSLVFTCDLKVSLIL